MIGLLNRLFHKEPQNSRDPATAEHHVDELDREIRQRREECPNTVDHYVVGGGGQEFKIRLYLVDGSMSPVMNQQEFVEHFRDYRWREKPGNTIMIVPNTGSFGYRPGDVVDVYMDNGYITTVATKPIFPPKVTASRLEQRLD